MTGAPRVIGFGAIAIDDILYVDRPLSAGKGRVIDRITDHGGNVATALVAVARLGGRAGFIGWLGDRSSDDAAARELEREGVDVSFAPRRGDARPIRSVIIVGSDGERFIAYDDDALLGASEELPDDVLAQARVLLIDGYATRASAVVARARQLGLAVVADIEWTIGPASETLMALADHLVLPYQFARNWTGEGESTAILRKLWSPDRAAVVLTAGDLGVYVHEGETSAFWRIPAYRVAAVDTTGAGDCFHGAYAYALSEGRSPLDCVLYANAAAAISVTGRGGRRSLPSHADCLARMAADAPAPIQILPPD